MNNNNYTTLATDEALGETIQHLAEHNVTAHIASSVEEAKKIILDLIPEGKEVMTATSTTLDQMELTPLFNESGKYDSIKSKLMTMDRATQELEMQKLGAAPEYVIGSVHAVTQDGKIMVVSGSGSQLAAYTYGSPHVVWVVSTKKIVKDIEDAFERINTHVLPLEDIRMKKIYGPNSGSHLNKIFILNKEMHPTRIDLVFVKEDLGF